MTGNIDLKVKSPKKGPNLLCRRVNISPQKVQEFVEILPKEKISTDEYRRIMKQVDGWFATTHQSAEQWGLFYFDDDYYYPRFTAVPSIEEAEEYVYLWMRKFPITNPYANFKSDNPNSLVLSIVRYLEMHPGENDLKKIIVNIIGEPFICNDIIVNAINNYSKVLSVKTISKENEIFQVSLKQDYQEIINTDYMDKKAYFELFNKPSSIINIDQPLQQIFYGAPGTGKSHKVNETICNLPKENVFRTTFHPDSDYSTFVGCYKPTKESVKLRDVTGKTIKDNVGGKEIDVTENRITYEFVPQVFTKAYVRAYQTDEPVFLVIEEINRGNCAQIFGDIFQLLDRDDCGVSAYAVKPDSDLENYLMEQLGDKYDPNEGMRLPNNLHIWATMNTSDQSLFPIDSAFKRRWDWVYVPIENHADKGYEIEVGNEKYDWWEFLDKMNERIYRATTSEDKKMGYFFVKLKKGEKKISEDVMVNKVLFYLFNDVFKDFDSEDLFKVDNKLMHFSDYHDKNNRSTLLKDLMSKLSLEPTNAESIQQAKQDNLDNTQN